MAVKGGLVLTIALLCFGLVCSAPVNDNNLDVDINKTLQNVQEILDANPLLPRLSKDEILFLLNNITAEDNKQKNEGTPNLTESDSADGEKIMVVLPFQPHNEDVTELFTKAPITKYVSSNANREELTTLPTKKKANKPKKATDPYKTDEAKDLTKVDESILSTLGNPKNKFSVIEDAAYFNHEFIDQHTVESADVAAFPEVSAYETFKPIPEGSRLDESIPIDVRNILKAIENEEILKAESTQAAQARPTYEIVNSEAMPAEMTSLLTELGLSMGKEGPKVVSSSSKARKLVAAMVDDLNSGKVEGLSNGPDPLTFEELSSVDDSIGNDIKKRQQSEATTEASTTTTTTTESAMDEEKISALEESFGGSSADNDPSEAELPPPRKNGFYYMVDWNSFLEVGDGDTKVNIRFDPKLGDPQRFIQVKVP